MHYISIFDIAFKVPLKRQHGRISLFPFISSASNKLSFSICSLDYWFYIGLQLLGPCRAFSCSTEVLEWLPIQECLAPTFLNFWCLLPSTDIFWERSQESLRRCFGIAQLLIAPVWCARHSLLDTHCSCWLCAKSHLCRSLDTQH